MCSPRAQASPFGAPVLIDKMPPQAETSRAALAEAEFDQAALAGENLRRQLAAVFAGHRALHALTIVEIGLPSFSNWSAQYWTVMPALLQRYS